MIATTLSEQSIISVGVNIIKIYHPYIGVYCNHCSRLPQLYFVVCCSFSQMGSTTTFCSSLSLNSALGVKVGLRAELFYGFPYKLHPKPKIAKSESIIQSIVQSPESRVQVLYLPHPKRAIPKCFSKL